VYRDIWISSDPAEPYPLVRFVTYKHLNICPSVSRSRNVGDVLSPDGRRPGHPQPGLRRGQCWAASLVQLVTRNRAVALLRSCRHPAREEPECWAWSSCLVALLPPCRLVPLDLAGLDVVRGCRSRKCGAFGALIVLTSRWPDRTTPRSTQRTRVVRSGCRPVG
jgi:hypothetical protein